MSKQTCKKSFIGFMVLTIFLWPLNPILSSPAMNKIVSDDGMLLRKLKVEQLEKIVNKNSVKQFFADGIKNQKANLSESKKKLSTDLLRLIDDSFLLPNQNHTQVVSQMKELKQFISKENSVKTLNRKIANKTHNDLVYVYVKFDPSAQTSVINSIVWEVTDRDEKNNLAVALVEVDKLEKLASVNGVKNIRSVLPPVVHSGSVVTEGDIIHRTNDVRSVYSQSGAGMKIGVISDGVNNRASAIDTGDLPAGLTVLSDNTGGDEGTAMLEIIHDMVPDADLYFHDCGNSIVAFNSAIDNLVSAGVDVIVDDIGWIGEPFFEDGTIASHVTDVLASKDIIYVSSAGNYAKQHYQGNYYNGECDFHDFSGGSAPVYKDLYVKIPSGASVEVVLQWNDSFGSSNNNYDLMLVDENGYNIIADSSITQDGNDDPLEFLSYVNTTGNTIEADIWVYNYIGSAVAKTLEVFIYPKNGTFIYSDNITPVDSIFGHKAVPDVIAVGAIAADDPDNDDIESFSSQGPVTIIGESQRAKPDVAGIDKVLITGAGGFGAWDGSNYIFPGTSAAAPHIAAIAAQLWGQYPFATGDQIREHLLNTAVDLGNTGFDYVFGHGRADALLAFEADPVFAKEITSFNFDGIGSGVINETEHTIAVAVPYDTDVTALIPTISITGSSVNPNSGVAQDFTNPVIYTVTAEDSTTQNYTVTVTADLNFAKAITSFDFTEGSGVIDETNHTIAVAVPYGTDVTSLIPTITITGNSISPVSGVAQDFTNPVIYTVTAEDSTTQNYTVTVTDSDVFSPDAISTLNVTNISVHTLKLNWTATGDDGNTGTASSYDIRYSTTEITNDNFDSAIQISSPSAPTPKEVGTKQSVEVNGLNQGTKYYFAMKVSDEVPNESGISNVVSVKTNTPRSSGGGGGSYTPPADKTPPAQPKHFKADRENEKIILTWENPKDSDFNKVLIVKSEELITSNLSIDDLKNKGKIIYEGNDEQYNDSDVDNDTVYYYAITAYDKKLNYTKLIVLETRPKINGQKTAQNSNGKVAVLGVETNYRTIQINNILSEAGYIYSGDSDSSAKNRKKQRDKNKETEIHNKYVARLVKGINGLIESNIRAFTNFILYSTETTDILGAGERAGVINSYKSAFGKLPTTESEWQDLIKIANGRWTTERSETAENNAKKEFKKVYKRDANMENPNDNAAVTIIAYGLRPNSRNLNSEKAGIKSFKHIYGYNPENATDWDIVRAIAYSGAIR